MTRFADVRAHPAVLARIIVACVLLALSALFVLSPPAPVPELLGFAVALAGALTLIGRRYDIAVRILWALTGATFALTLVHYNVACTSLYSAAAGAVAPEDVWLACAPAWPMFSAPVVSGALVLLLLAVRDAFADGYADDAGPFSVHRHAHDADPPNARPVLPAKPRAKASTASRAERSGGSARWSSTRVPGSDREPPN